MALSLRGRGVGGTPAGGTGIEVIVTQDDLRDLVRAINQHGDKKAVRRELSKGLREAVKPLVPKARAAVKSQSGPGTGLRNDMARSVQVKTDLGVRSERIGVRIRLDGSKLRGRPAGLVAMYEGVRPWRHPVFGTGTWVSQAPRGFLTEVVNANRANVLRQVAQTCDDIGRKLD